RPIVHRASDAPGRSSAQAFHAQTMVGLGAPTDARPRPLPSGISSAPHPKGSAEPGALADPPVGLMGAGGAPGKPREETDPFEALPQQDFEDQPTEILLRDGTSGAPDAPFPTSEDAFPSFDAHDEEMATIADGLPKGAEDPLWSLGRDRTETGDGSPSQSPPVDEGDTQADVKAPGVRWFRQRRIQIVAAIAVVLVLLGGVAVGIHWRRKTAQDQAVAMAVAAISSGDRNALASAKGTLEPLSPNDEVRALLAHVVAVGVYEYRLFDERAVADALGAASSNQPHGRRAEAYAKLLGGDGEGALAAIAPHAGKETAEDWHIHALVALEQGNQTDARKAALAAERLAPSSPRYASGRALTEEDFRKGLAVLAAVPGAKASPIAVHAKARILLGAGQGTAAAAETKRLLGDLAAAAGPTHKAWAHAIHGSIYADRGDFDKAIGAVHGAHALHPNPSAPLYLSLVDTALRSGDRGRIGPMVASLPQALFKTGPGALMLAQTRLASGDLEGAEKALSEAGQGPLATLTQARLFDQKGDVARATTLFAKAAQFSPLLVRSTVAFAEMMLRRGEPKKVLGAIGKLPPAHQGLPRAVYLRARAHLALGELKEAQELLSAIGDDAPVDFRLLRAKVALARGDRKDANKTVEQLLETHPKDPRVLAFAGRVRRVSGELEDARRMLEAALALDKDLISARVDLAWIAAQQGDLGGTQAVLQGLPEEDSEVREVTLFYRVLRGDGAGVADLLRDRAKETQDALFWNLYGDALLQAERAAPARQAYEEALRRDRSSAHAKVGLAWTTVRGAAPALARRLLADAEKAAKDEGPVLRCRLEAAKARFAYEQGGLAAATAAAKKALSVLPNCGPAHQVLGDMAIERGGDPIPVLEKAIAGVMAPPEAVGLLALRTKGERACELARRYLEADPGGFDAARVRAVAARCK
ncbi:MAG: hypothetical protein KC416_00915, partial [Myxococcales bacterium]|nr:hypothetical protein [Myxococcales bacterium]